MTQTGTLTLAEFLLARIAEEALDACVMAELHPDGTEDLDAFGDGYAVSSRMLRVARRALAECEAKRRIVEEHTPDGPDGIIAKPGETREELLARWQRHVDEDDPTACPTCVFAEVRPCPTLRLLALPYADHPDYREEWKP